MGLVATQPLLEYVDSVQQLARENGPGEVERKVASEAAIDIAIANQVPPFSAGSSSEVVALALNLAGQNETHAVSYATEAGLFQEAGAPAVVVGPGDIAQAHTADEWISLASLERGKNLLFRFLNSLP